MVDLEFKAIARRIRKCALDLLSLGNDLMEEEEECWDSIQRDLRLRSTLLFCDLNKIIRSSPRERKNSLVDLSNKFFCSIQQVDDAVKTQSISSTKDRCNDADLIFREIIELLFSISTSS